MIRDAKYFNMIYKKNINKKNIYYINKSRKIVFKEIKRQAKHGEDSVIIYNDFFEHYLYYNSIHRGYQLFLKLLDDLDYYKSLGFTINTNTCDSTFRDVQLIKIFIGWNDIGVDYNDTRC